MLAVAHMLLNPILTAQRDSKDLVGGLKKLFLLLDIVSEMP